MEFDYLLVTIVSGISSASILIIVTIGLAVVFGLMGVINLAHGEFIMFGAYAALILSKAGVPFPIAVILASIITALFGAVVERLIIKPLYGRLLDTLLVTWGLSLVLYQSAVIMFGTVTPGIGLAPAFISIGDYGLSVYLLSMIAVAAFMVIGVYILLTQTKYGIAARAAIQDQDTALTLGIETNRMNTITFALGSGLAGFAGAILLPLIPATPDMGFAFVAKAFLTVVAAGPVTISGTVLAGSFLGLSSSLVASFHTKVFADIVFFLLTILIFWKFPLGISEKWKNKL